MTARGPQSGFTLLEILVALVVLAALLAGLAQGVQFGVRAWNTQVGAVARNADLDTVDRVLRGLIGRAEPPAAPDRPSLTGAPNEVSFQSELPEAAPVIASRMAAITLLVDHNRLILRWQEQPHAVLLGPAPPVHDEVLLDGIAGLDMGYRDRAGQWSTSWSMPTLPQLVKIHLAFAGPHPRRWPDLLIAPMRDGINETGN